MIREICKWFNFSFKDLTIIALLALGIKHFVSFFVETVSSIKITPEVQWEILFRLLE